MKRTKTFQGRNGLTVAISVPQVHQHVSRETLNEGEGKTGAKRPARRAKRKRVMRLRKRRGW